MKKLSAALSVSGLILVTQILTGCSTIATLNPFKDDKLACDSLSNVLTASSQATTTQGALDSFEDLSTRLETEVLPLAGTELASDLRQAIKSVQMSSSESIFDAAGSILSAADAMARVTDRCVTLGYEESAS